MPDVALSEHTMGLLKRLARPLEDTPDTLIERLARAALARDFRIIDPQTPSDHTQTGEAIGNGSVEVHVNKMSATAREMFERVCKIVYDIDPNISMHGTQGYVGCRINGNNFAAIFPQ